MSTVNNPESLEDVKAQVSETTKKVGEIGNLFHQFKEANEENSKKRDVVIDEKLNKLGEAIATVHEVKQKAELMEMAIQKGLIQGGGDKAETLTPEMKSYVSSFGGYLRGSVDEKELKEMQKKALSVGSDPDGGYLVTPAMSARISTRIFESSPLRALATVETISTDSLEMVIDDDEASASWTGETTTITETDTPQVGLLTIPVHNLYAEPRATQKVIDDTAINLEQWLANKVADQFARTEADAFFNGTGVNKPRGILTYSDWAVAGTYERGKVEQVDSGSNGTYDGDDLIELQGTLKEAYRNGAVWLMKRSVFTTLLKIKANNEYILSDFRTQSGSGFTLLGNPVYFADGMAAAATGSLSIAYGNFAQGYTIVDRIGVRILRDPFTAKPFVKYYTTKRVGGDVTNFDAFKILKLS